MNVIITGSTGMVGKSVLLECLEDSRIDKILVINRHSIKMNHSKIEELIHQDFTNLEPIQHKLIGYDACFHCMGVSSIGMNEDDFSKLTFDITNEFADKLFETNPNAVFNYVSGTGTDSTEKGNIMWARVKGKTENYIINKGFKDAYMFRAGAIIPEKGIKSSTGWYNTLYVILRPFFGLMKKYKNITTTTKLGKAMINTLFFPQKLKHLENRDINNYAAIQ